jgi:hypothetical protein
MCRINLGLALILAGILPAAVHADLYFKEPIANAGSVYSGTPLVHRFTFVNQGPEAVEITEARASCGCLAPRLEQRTFKPGEEGKLDLEVRTLSQAAGPHTWSVRLSYQTGGKVCEMSLQLHARVFTEVSVEPASLNLFADKAAGHEITLTDRRAQPLTLTDVRISSPKVQPRLSEPARDSAGHWIRKVRLEVASDFPVGRHDEVLVIYTDDPKYPDLKVPVTILKQVQQRLAATPDRVTLAAARGQLLPARIVLIRDNAEQQVKIDNVMVDDPALTCKWAEGPGKLCTLRIQVDRSRLQGGRLHSAVHVEISQPLRETLTIPVTCTTE